MGDPAHRKRQTRTEQSSTSPSRFAVFRTQKPSIARCLAPLVGRDTGKWADIVLFGHQVTLHERPSQVLSPAHRGVRHILPWQEWQALGARLIEQGCAFVMAPAVSKSGTEQEQGEMLLCDPSDNLMEIKAYRNVLAVFA